MSKDNRIQSAIKAIIAILILCILFLFALNGRYEVVSGRGAVLDKWRGVIIGMPFIDKSK